jgi:ComF family protein
MTRDNLRAGWAEGVAVLRAARRAALDLCFPRSCAGCGAPDPEAMRHLCWECFRDLAVLQPPFCERCGDPVAGRVDHAYTCALCAARAPSFLRARSAVRYDGAAASAIRALKYHGATWLADDLAALLEGVTRAEYAGVTFDAIVPVPLHPLRRRRRDFNQAELLAGRLARRLGAPVRARAVRRVRATPSQTRLTVRERADNMRGAFQARAPMNLDGGRVLLVDDVMTTGATVHDAARALREGGVAEVWVVTVARG